VALQFWLKMNDFVLVIAKRKGSTPALLQRGKNSNLGLDGPQQHDGRRRFVDVNLTIKESIREWRRLVVDGWPWKRGKGRC
jgi:hypothetical protein